MKTNATKLDPPVRAFTLIELLVVIAVIAILAALLFPVTAVLKKKKIISIAQAELAQVETAIEAYKSKYGHYPPDNPGNYVINQLYFELEGTIKDSGGVYQTLDGSGRIIPAQFPTVYGAGVSGFVNSSTSAKGTDDKAAAIQFIKDLKPNQDMTLTSGVRLLTCSVLVDKPPFPVLNDGSGMNPWRYNSSTPANNPGSYDLWVDLVISGKTNRVCNWSRSVLVLP